MPRMEDKNDKLSSMADTNPRKALFYGMGIVITTLVGVVIYQNNIIRNQEEEFRLRWEKREVWWQLRYDALSSGIEVFKEKLMNEYKKKSEESDEAIKRFMNKDQQTKVYIRKVREGQGKNIRMAKNIEEKVLSVSNQEE